MLGFQGLNGASPDLQDQSGPHQPLGQMREGDSRDLVFPQEVLGDRLQQWNYW